MQGVQLWFQLEVSSQLELRFLKYRFSGVEEVSRRDKGGGIGDLRQGTWVGMYSGCKQYSTTFSWSHSF